MVEVRLVSMTPDPERLVCTCARNDYYDGNVATDDFEKVMVGVGGDTLEEKMETLIKKLMLRGHWGVFEHPQLTIHFRASRACMAQITRHRHASFDIQSQRYVDFRFVNPTDGRDIAWPLTWDAEQVKSREGTRPITLPVDERRKLIEDAFTTSLDAYNKLVEAGIPKEDARMVLPIGTKVNITMSMSVRSALHVLNIRGAGDAQAEVRLVSQGLREVLEKAMPITMRVWNEQGGAILRQRLSP